MEQAGPSALARCAHERAETSLLSALFADPATRVLELRSGLASVCDDRSPAPYLRWREPCPDDAGALQVFLGRDARSVPHVLAAHAEAPVSGRVDRAGPNEDAAGRRWWPLREVGARLGEADTDQYLTGLALANWHRTHPRCASCGTPTLPATAGWTRRCPKDGRDHFPRTDPAVIMAVVDQRQLLLLGRNPAWPLGRRSVLAGFVEPGETLEAAVAREVAEEVGIAVTDITYVGSQPWPFPASLMLGFEARAAADALALDEGEIVEAEWYTRAELAHQVVAGTLTLPGRLSIARRLVERWYGGALTPPVEVPFVRAEPD